MFGLRYRPVSAAPPVAAARGGGFQGESSPLARWAASSPPEIRQGGSVVDQDNKREDEWFLRKENQLLDAARTARLKREQERAGKAKAEETRGLKDPHSMK